MTLAKTIQTRKYNNKPFYLEKVCINLCQVLSEIHKMKIYLHFDNALQTQVSKQALKYNHSIHKLIKWISGPTLF